MFVKTFYKLKSTEYVKGKESGFVDHNPFSTVDGSGAQHSKQDRTGDGDRVLHRQHVLVAVVIWPESI
jgi:hypothetical protein